MVLPAQPDWCDSIAPACCKPSVLNLLPLPAFYHFSECTLLELGLLAVLRGSLAVFSGRVVAVVTSSDWALSEIGHQNFLSGSWFSLSSCHRDAVACPQVLELAGVLGTTPI